MSSKRYVCPTCGASGPERHCSGTAEAPHRHMRRQDRGTYLVFVGKVDKGLALRFAGPLRDQDINPTAAQGLAEGNDVCVLWSEQPDARQLQEAIQSGTPLMKLPQFIRLFVSEEAAASSPGNAPTEVVEVALDASNQEPDA